MSAKRKRIKYYTCAGVEQTFDKEFIKQKQVTCCCRSEGEWNKGFPGTQKLEHIFKFDPPLIEIDESICYWATQSLRRVIHSMNDQRVQ